MQVLAALAGAGLAVVAEQAFQFREQVVVRPEVAEVLVAGLLGLGLTGAHFLAVIAVEAVTLDDGGADALTAEDVFEGARDAAGAGAAGAGDGDDGVAF